MDGWIDWWMDGLLSCTYYYNAIHTPKYTPCCCFVFYRGVCSRIIVPRWSGCDTSWEVWRQFLWWELILLGEGCGLCILFILHYFLLCLLGSLSSVGSAYYVCYRAYTLSKPTEEARSSMLNSSRIMSSLVYTIFIYETQLVNTSSLLVARKNNKKRSRAFLVLLAAVPTCYLLRTGCFHPHREKSNRGRRSRVYYWFIDSHTTKQSSIIIVVVLLCLTTSLAFKCKYNHACCSEETQTSGLKIRACQIHPRTHTGRTWTTIFGLSPGRLRRLSCETRFLLIMRLPSSGPHVRKNKLNPCDVSSYRWQDIPWAHETLPSWDLNPDTFIRQHIIRRRRVWKTANIFQDVWGLVLERDKDYNIPGMSHFIPCLTVYLCNVSWSSPSEMRLSWEKRQLERADHHDDISYSHVV